MDDIDKVATDGPEQAIQILLDHQPKLSAQRATGCRTLKI
jgi:hypothetical protein